MTPPLTHVAPQSIVAGDSIDFLVAIPAGYEDWTGSARLTGPGSTLDATSCDTESSDFHVKFSGQTTLGTKNLVAGQFALTVWATSGTDRKTIAQFPITVTPDLSTGTPRQAHALTMLRVVEAEIQARITGNGSGQEGYQVDGTMVTKIPIEQLERLRNKYSAEVAALTNPNGGIPRVKFVVTPTGGIADVRRRFQ